MEKELKEIYVLLLADKEGNFEWVYTLPKPYYETKEEAEEVRRELIKNEKTVTEKNSKVKKLLKMSK